MRKNMFVAAAMVAVAFGFTACSSSQAVSSTAKSARETAMMSVPSIELADAKPATRDYGEGTDLLEESWAKQSAEEAARAAFQRKIETWVSSASESSMTMYQKASSNGAESSKVADQAGKRSALNKALAEGIVRNTAVIKTDRYRTADGGYHVYVCIEYMGEIGDMVRELSDSMEKLVEQQVSDDERLQIQFEKEQFEKSLQDDFERFREEKKNK